MRTAAPSPHACDRDERSLGHRARLGAHQRPTGGVATVDLDVARHSVALKAVVPTCTLARVLYGIGGDEGPRQVGSNKKCNRENDRFLKSISVPPDFLKPEPLARALRRVVETLSDFNARHSGINAPPNS